MWLLAGTILQGLRKLFEKERMEVGGESGRCSNACEMAGRGNKDPGGAGRIEAV